MFAVSPRVRDFGLGQVSLVDNSRLGDGIHTFGLILTLLALVGLFLARRRRSAWLLTLLWAGCAALALGPVLRLASHNLAPAALQLDGQRVSGLMPFTWFVQLPLLSGFREASRIMTLGMLPAALLAGAAVDWLRHRAAPAAIIVFALACLELGWSGAGTIGTLPTALPAVDRGLVADHSDSIVVDVPYGIRGGTNWSGLGFDPDAQVLAAADGHPRAVGFISRISPHTLAGLDKDSFYTRLLAAQQGDGSTPTQLAAARANARALNIGWVLIWSWPDAHAPRVQGYIRQVGFSFDYQADGVQVYRGRASPPATARR
jgi:hypothetical protein